MAQKKKILTPKNKKALHRLKVWKNNQRAKDIFLGGFIVLMVFLILIGLNA